MLLFVLELLAVLLFKWGLPGAWVALMADQCLRTLLITLRYNSGKWQTALVKRNQPAPAR